MRILARLGDGPASLDELAHTHRYHLGARIHELSSRGLDQREVRGIALPHLTAFNREHGRTTHLCELLGTEIVYIDKLESHDHVRMASRIGLRAPVHCTAAGKTLVAELAPADREELIAELALVPRTPNTITDPNAFRAELDRVRAAGWAHDGEENEPSVNCIAAPVRDAAGRAVAAVSVSVPNIVLSDQRLLELLPSLLAVTERISRDCGWRPVPDGEQDTVKGHPA